jgi:hypothetical protein
VKAKEILTKRNERGGRDSEYLAEVIDQVIAPVSNVKKMSFYGAITRLLDRIVDRRNPEYHIILRIGSGSHSDSKFARNDWNGDPLEGHRSDPF